MKKSKLVLGLMALMLVLGMLAGCSGNGRDGEAGGGANGGGGSTDGGGAVKGEITVITQRTDIVDTVFKQYAAEFNKEYPDVKVNFQALSDYEGQITVRMSSDDYGDVLLLPTSIPLEDTPQFLNRLAIWRK